MTKEALKLALEALENHCGNYKLDDAGCERWNKAVDAIKEALVQRQLESTTDMMMGLADRLGELPDDIDPRAWEHLLVYAPKRQPLTESKIKAIANIEGMNNRVTFARAIEAAHNIKETEK